MSNAQIIPRTISFVIPSKFFGLAIITVSVTTISSIPHRPATYFTFSEAKQFLDLSTRALRLSTVITFINHCPQRQPAESLRLNIHRLSSVFVPFFYILFTSVIVVCPQHLHLRPSFKRRRRRQPALQNEIYFRFLSSTTVILNLF